MKKYLLISVFILAFLNPQTVFAASYVCSATGTATTSASPDFFNIFEGYYNMPQGQEGRLKLFKNLKTMGIKTVRINLGWPALEKTQGTYTLAYADAIMKDIQTAGLAVLVNFGGVPDWARPSGGQYSGKIVIDPSHMADWKKFIQEIVRRYDSRTGSVAKVANGWEIFNEPDTSFYYEGTADSLVSLLNYSYDSIKEIDPVATVWSPPPTAAVLNHLFFGTPLYSSNGPDFFTKVVASGKFDVLSIHLYLAVDRSMEIVQKTRQYLRANGSDLTKNSKIGVTETNEPIDSSKCDQKFGDGEDASLIIDRYVCLKQAGADYVYYFMATDITNTPLCVTAKQTVKVGIFNQDGTPRKSYLPVKNMIHTLTSRPGDFNGDGKVNFDDFTYIKDNFVKAALTIFDYNNLVTNYGK